MNLTTWSERWWQHMPPQMQQEFMAMIQPHSFVQPEPSEKSESAVQADIRLAASKEFAAPLWRNNSGAAEMINSARPQDPPRHVRFGLGNDSKRVNDAWKSSDLIGITPVRITAAHVGQTFGVFTAVEVKEPGWTMRPSDKRAKAQHTFMTAVQVRGGFAGFAQSVGDLRRIIHNGRPQEKC